MRFRILTLLLLPLALSSAAADESIALFDGKTLDGWVTLDDKPIVGGWEVIDGTMHLNRGKQRVGHIKTARNFENFILEFEWRIAARGNSGVKYFLKKSDSEFGTNYFGCEYQLLDDEKHKNGRFTNKSAGALYDLYAPDARHKHLRPVGEFNHSRIMVDQGRIEHWLNGKRIVEATIGSDDWRRRIKESKFASVADFANGPGAIMLQDHGADVWFRNIRITPLPVGGSTGETLQRASSANQ